ncbi:hypothetical protein AGABI2DRAFT_176303 [Agaricus bisporus var. bisporus H97]|uniref:hypothetical protein n=1 Tax=Agaricus bisporus var. bisporus (strain H97 / ATCC MYA-4626 / FGSC 10389) TaxID=936046 RepID=UPI00029F75B0|nr:hypothetical protein AGABI2DRAFT_176303 [Agaricus bisporus var. bisporus H97]EKV51980.1 hypothetical protein AGABI2DRAFT_176303 [Agaricus bisporus var. bisporus H97]
MSYTTNSTGHSMNWCPNYEQDVDAAPSSSRQSVPGSPSHSQSSTGYLLVNTAPDDFGVCVSSPRGSVVQQDIHVALPSKLRDSIQVQQSLAPLPLSYRHATSSQQSFNLGPLILQAGQDLPPRQRQNQGAFNQAHNFTVTESTFVDGNSEKLDNTTSNIFMEKLLKETIPGAASDSSARDPPPRCHPGTRLAILDRCLWFIAHCSREEKIRWVVGAAGVGKSAIMQNVTESPKLQVACHVSVFFSVNGRNDGTKAIITLSYQLAAKSAPYRQLIECEIARDPSLLQSSMRVQFKKLIIEPFIHKSQLLNSAERILVVVDGLDECNNRDTQLQLLRLISDFCIKYPSSPIVWLIASRPEQHITSFFSSAHVMSAYEKEEIVIDSDEACADVERYLRHKLKEIKEASYSFDPHSEWPEERDLWKLASASGGLFAYAHTIIRYIDDLKIGNPVSQLSDVLKVIDHHPMSGIPREDHPMALLDALYARILSNVPHRVFIHTRKLILALVSDWDEALYAKGNFVELCNWLGMTPDEAYAAVNLLHSVFRIPRRDEAQLEGIEPFHKSFIDYVSDFSRSGFSRNIEREAQQLKTECAFRILNEAPNGIDFGDVDYAFVYGTLGRGPGTGDTISLTWPVGIKVAWANNLTRLKIYKLSVGVVAKNIELGDPIFRSSFCIRLLTTWLVGYDHFQYHLLHELVFDESRRHEFMMNGILNRIPVGAVNISNGLIEVRLRFHGPARKVTKTSDTWYLSCLHERKGEWEEGKDQDWKTSSYGCNFCYKWFKRQLASLQTHSPEHMVTVLFTCAGKCCVEFRFVDPDDGISEWTCWLSIWLTLEERKKYGSTV